MISLPQELVATTMIQYINPKVITTALASICLYTTQSLSAEEGLQSAKSRCRLTAGRNDMHYALQLDESEAGNCVWEDSMAGLIRQ